MFRSAHTGTLATKATLLALSRKQTVSSCGESHRVIILLSRIYQLYRYFDCNKLLYYGDRQKEQSSADLNHLQGIINIKPLPLFSKCTKILYNSFV